MSQLEKFNARKAKAAKIKKDEEVIQEAEMKESTIEKQGQKVAKQYGYSTEDIFMIIARDSMELWTKMWNNSMENVIRETIREELPQMIQQVVQEELALAARGFMKGLMPQPKQGIEEKIKIYQPKNALQQMELDIKESMKFEQTFGEAFESKLNEMKQDVETDLKSISIEPFEESETYYKTDERTRLAIIEFHKAGNDPAISKEFKKVSSQHNTMYQRFSKFNPGRGHWKQYVKSVISEHDNAELTINEDEKHD